MCVTQEQLETMNVRKRRQAQGTTRKRAEGAEDGGGSWLPGAEIENQSTGRSELLCMGGSACALTNFGAWQRGAIRVIRCKLPACDLLP